MNDTTPLTLKKGYHKFLTANRGVISENTISYYRSALGQLLDYLGDRAMDGIALEDLEEWRASLFDRRLAPSTVDSMLRAARRFFRWLHDRELIGRNVSAKLKRPRVPDMDPKALELADLRRVLGYLANQERRGLEPQNALCRDRAVILLLADTGCRAGGLCGLTLGAIDLDARTAIVAEKGRGGDKRRLVFYSPATAAALRDWLYYHPLIIDGKSGQDAPLFVSFDNRPGGRNRERMTVSGIYHITRTRAEAAGVKGRFNPHAFRHMAAREWLRNGADLASVSQMLGHSGIEVTAKHYARFAKNELADLHTRVSVVGAMAGD